MPELLRLDANECFDYFINNFENIFQNESTCRINTNLDPEISTDNLYLSLKENYLSEIIDQEKFQNMIVKFSRGMEVKSNFIIATFTNPIDSTQVKIEINRGESPESIRQSFLNGYNTLQSTYAPEVHEMKMSNYK